MRLNTRKGAVVLTTVVNADNISLTIKGETITLTHEELDHLFGAMIPHVSHIQRHMISLFENLSYTDRQKIGLLLMPQ